VIAVPRPRKSAKGCATLSFSAPIEFKETVYEELRKIAEREKRPVSELIVEALTIYLILKRGVKWSA